MTEIEEYYRRQIEWSRNTFGPALRTKGIIDHIKKELREIEAEPHDLDEWVDVIILAMDGFWRHGGTPEDLMLRLLAKQEKNMARTWPDWRTMSEFKLTDDVMLKALRSAVSPDSAYIGDEVHRLHHAHVKDGGTGRPPSASQILRALRSLQRKGKIEPVGSVPNGYYGHRWRIVE